MKTAAFLLAASAMLCAPGLSAATVSPNGYTNDFGVQPAASDWATVSIAGGAGDAYDLDADVNGSITAAGVIAQTTANAAVPAAQAGTASWSSSGFYLQTRPTGNRYTVLMGKFVNETGTNATAISVSYLFTIAAGGIPEEDGRGNRAYYSLSGAAGSWINIAALNTTASADGVLPATAAITVDWPHGTSLYLLWADDNATGQGTDAANQIDDFALRVTAGAPLVLTAALAAPADNAVLPSGAVTAAAMLTFGTAPFNVEYFISSGGPFTSAGSSATAPFNVSLGNLTPGTYSVYAVATDSAVPPASVTTTSNTFSVADPITFNLIRPADGATFDRLVEVTAEATVSGGSAPYSVQFYLDGVANGAAVSAPPYERNFGALFVGDHTIHATVTDTKGWTSNSLPHVVRITGPLGVSLTPTNGAFFIFGQPVALAAAAGGGTAPYTVTFYTNDQPAGSLSSAPFTLPLGILPSGNYTSYVRAVDSATPAAEAISTINVLTVLPNPIVVNLTSPTNGQGGSAGAPLALAASATVGAPLSITNVQFFYDGTLAGTDNAAPYSASVAAATQGSHTVYAVATDNLGRQSFSQTNQVTISTAAGSNDNFNNAIPLFGPIVTTTGNNLTATRQGGFFGEPFHGGNFGGASVWWTWTATASGPTTIDTFGSDFNTLLGVYTGNAVNQLTTIAGNNDFEGNSWSRVQFNAVGGTVYRIAVDGFSPGFPPNPARGNIVLNVKGVGGVEITTPANGAVFTVGDPVPVEVGITSDFPNPPAGRVDFFLNGVAFASRDSGPYTAVLTNAPPGSNILHAVAVDSLGQPVQSAQVRIFVQKIGVTILTPFEDTIFPNTNPITVTAWAYLPSGSITNIEFFVDGIKVGEDSTSPFSATWSQVTPGSHRITAIGRADTGQAYNSQPVNVGVVNVLVPFASVWKYLDDGSDQGVAWIAPNFDDSTWLSGPAPLGYSDSNGRLPATTNSFGPDANAKYTNTYYRHSFVASNMASYSQIVLGIERDDGAIVYLNGAEVARFNMPTGIVTSTTPASSNAGDDGGTLFTVIVSPALFLEGLNTFAVEVHQDNSGNSTDIWFQMTLVGVPVIIHNLSPLVSITTPTNQQYFLAPESITLEAEASDPDGSVAKVKYFADGVEIGEATNAPYTVVWTTPSVAAYTLTAVATDDLGATTTSQGVPIVVYDAVGTPVAAVTSPANGAVMEGPTNLLITATANAITGVTNVQFLADGAEFGNDDSAAYSAIWTAPFGTSVLRVVAFDANGIMGTSPPVTVVITIPPTNVIAPSITTQIPLAGSTLTNLTNITVRFSEYVQNVDASDLLINGIPATSVNASHSRSNYTFTFPHPHYGQVNISWAPDHGITDYGWPTVLSFDGAGAGATWSYDLIDQTAPVISARTPAANSTVTNLLQITVRFSEAVSGVDASDLLVNGFPGIEVSGDGSNFTWRVSQPPSGTVNITWATNHNIFDLAATPNAFNRTAAGATWSFTLDARQVLVQSNSVWRFIKGTAEASTPSNAWRQVSFDDSSWSNSAAPFFFGDNYTNASNRGTLLSDMLNNYSSVYLRQEFTVLNRGDITNLIINAQSDDGFIAWINGVEVRRYNAPAGQPAYNVVATANAPEPQNNGAGYIVATLNTAAAALVDGRNVLAIQAFNQHATNNDFGFNAQLYTFPLDSSTVGPRLLTPVPTPGDVLALSNITVTFSESVSGVDATDLLVNGVPAASVNSTTNTTYTFSFAQPPYGPVLITWDTNHAIQDFDGPPKVFNATAASSTFSYFLINPSNPKVLTQIPLAGATVTGLTAVVVTFTEPVSGVNAADFLINGSSATSVSSTDNVTYSFAFTEPSFGPVAIRWATNHGIVDLEAGNGFDPTRFGGQWNYTLVNPAPSVTITGPTNGTYRLQPATVTVTATASDNDGTIARVDFYEGSTLVGGAATTPYSITLSNLLLGIYTFRAVATDNMGLLGTSAPVVLNVVTSLPAALVRGPYLQVGTPTGGLVRWRTDVASDGLVYYGTDPLSLTNFAVQLTVTNEHIVQITGLEPDTKYYYSIGSAAQRLAGTNGVDSEFWFQTSPLPGTRKPMRIWVLGDMGTAGNGAPDRQISTRDAFYNFAATNGRANDIWLLLGDNAYNTGTDAEHQRAVFDMFPSTLRNKFLWPALGNHETSQSTTATDFPYLHIFSLPQNGEAGGVASGTEKYYSFDYGNIHFVCLDSMTSGQTANTPMANWLREDLAAANAEWIIVFFHHPPYTKGSHDSDREQDLVNIRQNLVPILESNGVDLVLSGHSHCWERSYLLDGHYGMSGTLTESMKVNGGDGRVDGDGAYSKNANGRGVVYTVAGSAGQATGGTLDLPAHFRSLNELGTMVIDVNENRLEGMFLHANGEIQDHFTLLKPDLRPATPLNLVAHPAGPDSITLQWADMGTNELGFSIERSTDGVNFSQQLTAPADAVTALDTGLVMNVTYYYRVRSTNDIGESQFSNIASATPVLATTAPQAPGNLIALSDDGVRFYRSRMIVSWQDRSSDEGAFQIERSPDALVFVPVATVGANITTFLDEGLESASLYFYRVRAVNSAGVSGSSNFAGDETHPQSQLARAGDTVSFHAGVEGAPDIRYQWQFMGSVIAGATSETLTLASAQPSDQGQYTVVLSDAKGNRTSNPATLIVVSPPRILTQPQDYVRGVGMNVEFTVAAEGTPPLRYYWRKNGALTGVSTPVLALSSIGFGDQASYDVVVENNFGAVTSRVATLRVYSLPTIAAVSDIFAEVLQPLRITFAANDANVPPLDLRFALRPGAPTNAVLDARTGFFRWTPNRSQAPSTNLISVNVFDQANPILSGTMSFNVFVNHFAELAVGSLIMLTGTNGAVPLTFFSSLDVAALACELHFVGEHFSDVSFAPVGPESATGSVGFQREDANTAMLTVSALPGRTLLGMNPLGHLRFDARAQTNSALVPLKIEDLNVTLAATGAPTILAQHGQVIVVGQRPLLEAHFTPLGAREVTLFGRPGTYNLQWATNLVNPVWRLRGSITIPATNLMRSVAIGNTPPTNMPGFFRIRQ